MKNITDILIILLSISISSTAHVFLKKGAMAINQASFMNAHFFDKTAYMVTSPWLVSGLMMHAGALVIWIWALSRVDVSFAYPFLTLGLIIVSLMAYFWMGENMSVLRIIGMVVIVIGLLIISKGR